MLVARCALERPGGAAAALEALRPLVAGAPSGEVTDLALEALLALDEPRVAAAWARVVEGLPRDRAAALRAACALAQGDWSAALLPADDGAVARRLRARAAGAGAPAADALAALGPPPAAGPDPAAAERAAARLVALTERPSQAAHVVMAHAAVASAGARALGRLGRPGQEAAARVQAALVSVERDVLEVARRPDAAAGVLEVLEGLAALRPGAPEGARLHLLRLWARWAAGGALPGDPGSRRSAPGRRPSRRTACRCSTASR
ncbi:MAG: hypothetical protein M9894_18110 [Planctomycetes bacterium]|nr:hypothetical protein [Planctomycetota bacterium]